MDDDNPGDRFLPHPAAGWYDRAIGTTGGGVESVARATPEQRRSYVRYILAGHGGKRSWDLAELAEWEPSALAPWADAVTEFDDAALTRLSDVEWPDFWHAAAGASDAAVDRLAARIAAGGAGAARVQMLVGVDTDRALQRLGDLGRGSAEVEEICGTYGLWVPPAGPAVRRYQRGARCIMQVQPADGPPEAGLRVLPPAADVFVDPRQDCALPLSVVLDVDLALLPGLQGGEGRRHPFVGSFCQDCEAEEDIRGDRGWRPAADGRLEFDEERDERCPGEAPQETWEQPHSLVLRPSRRYEPYDPRTRQKEIGRLGGRPDWAQYPVWLGCCDKPMFFVGQTYLFHFGGAGAHLFGFACECGAGNQVAQIT